MIEADPARERAAGAGYALAAYGAWGVVPIYWKALGHVPAVEVLAQRVVWSVVFLSLVLTVLRRWGAAFEVARSWPRLRVLLVTTALIGVNWGLFIWAVQSGHLLEASLGYFINPLVNVALGVVVLGERLRRIQLAAVALAAVGVLALTASLGVPPWLALALAFTFGGYGLLRKTAPIEPLVGLFVETALCAPVALAVVIACESTGRGALGSHSLRYDLLLASSGVITALPLAWFASAARRLPLSTLGLFQYVSPTCQFLLAVFVYGEPFGRAQLAAFACIWTALALYSFGSLRAASAR